MMLVLAMQFSRAGGPQCRRADGLEQAVCGERQSHRAVQVDRGWRSLKTEQKTKASGQLGSRPRETMSVTP